MLIQNFAKGERLPNRETIWNKTFICLFIANAMMYLSQMMMNTLVSKYTNSLGASAAVVGVVMSAFTWTALILKVVSAPALDAFNKKFILAGAMFVMSLAYWGYGFSDNIPMLLSSRLLQGAGQAFTATCCLALAADSLPRDKMGSGLGVFSLAQAICQAIGPSCGLYLAEFIGYTYTFFTGAVLMTVACLLVLTISVEKRPRKKFKISLGSMFAKEAILPACLALLFSMAYFNINSFLVIYAEDIGIEGEIGLFFTVYAVTLLFTRPLIGKLSDKYGIHNVLLPAMCCFAVSFIIISFARSLPAFLVAAFISAFGYGACTPTVQALCMKRVGAERRGAGSCTNYVGQDLGSLLGPIIGGFVVGHFGYPAMWRIMLLPVLIAAVVVIIFRKDIASSETARAGK